MKAALVLNSESPSLPQQAAEINVFVKNMATTLSSVELWFFYGDGVPETFPELACPLSCIKIIKSENTYLPEAVLPLLELMAQEHPVDILLFSSDGSGAELATRLAYRLKGSACLQVESCKPTPHGMEVTKPVYGNNLTAQFVLKCAPYFLSVAKHPCPPAHKIPYNHTKKTSITLNQPRCDWVKEVQTIPDERDTRLASADMVLVAGQGVKDKKTVDMLRCTADKIGAGFGASRPVVMNAWAAMNRLIGTSGLIIAPKICIAAGVSGTAVFSAGIINSELIVAINNDRHAPIFKIAHAGIVGDLKAVLAELEKLIVADSVAKGSNTKHASGIEKQ